MLEGILIFLLWLLVYALVAYVVVWILLLVLGLFIAVPPKIQQLMYAIAGLLILIWAVTHIPAHLPS
jgi:hypothetical protein